MAVTLHIQQAHASKLAQLIETVLARTDHAPSDLCAIAVASGPGSYTGLRIGAATAKGMCFGLSIPLIALPTLMVLAQQVVNYNATQAWLCPMLDARRMEVYCCVIDAALNVLEPTHAKIIDESSFINLLDEHPIIFFGNGAAKCKEVIVHPNAVFYNNVNVDAAAMGELAFQKFKETQFENLQAFEPVYGKEFVALKGKSLLK